MTTGSEQLQAFFGRVGRASLKLPSGWFGRPMDNLHALTQVAVTDEGLVVELDGRHRLVLSGPVRVADEGFILRLTEFASARWESTGWGSQATTKVATFDGGQIEFHSAHESQ